MKWGAIFALERFSHITIEPAIANETAFWILGHNIAYHTSTDLLWNLMQSLISNALTLFIWGSQKCPGKQDITKQKSYDTTSEVSPTQSTIQK